MPCLLCESPQAWQARREICKVYLRARAWELPRPEPISGQLPSCCCQRTGKFAVETMIA